MGLTHIFSSISELPGITGEGLSINEIVQIAEIEVDEKGAKASAATGKPMHPQTSKHGYANVAFFHHTKCFCSPSPTPPC